MMISKSVESGVRVNNFTFSALLTKSVIITGEQLQFWDDDSTPLVSFSRQFPQVLFPVLEQEAEFLPCFCFRAMSCQHLTPRACRASPAEGFHQKSKSVLAVTKRLLGKVPELFWRVHPSGHPGSVTPQVFGWLLQGKHRFLTLL